MGSTFLVTLGLALVLILLAFAGIGIKMFFQKDGKFAGTCATNNPLLKNEIGECGVCGKKPEEDCKAEELGLNPA